MVSGNKSKNSTFFSDVCLLSNMQFELRRRVYCGSLCHS